MFNLHRTRGDYHGSLKNTLPRGIAGVCRHPGLVQCARTLEFSYVRDPDYGDEAYDLRTDPRELVNLLNDGAGPEPAEVAALRRQLEQWQTRCVRLGEQLGVVPGDRGFFEGWE